MRDNKSSAESVSFYGDQARIFGRSSESIVLKAVALAKKAGKKHLTKNEIEKALQITEK